MSEDTKLEVTTSEGIKSKETVSEVTTSADMIPTETSEGIKVGETISEVTTSEDAKPEDAKSEGSKPEDEKSESMKPEETKSEDIIAVLEEQFKDRYTENDPAHKAVLDMKEASPPVVVNFGYGSHNSSSSASRVSRDDRSGNKRVRSRSRSKSPVATLKRKGMFGCYSYFVFYY